MCVLSKVETKAKQYYNITEYPKKGGYILTDGSILDFSEGQNYRTLDHFDIENIYNNKNRDEAFEDFIVKGAMRLIPEVKGVELYKKPTEAQLKTIKYINLIFDNELIIEKFQGITKNSIFIGGIKELTKYFK